MQKVSYMGDGTTTEFSFNFPYFENTNIIVTKNASAATGYTIVGTSAGLDADIPYTGGKVVFETAPTALDNITIARNLPLNRVADYQPTEKINPTTLNQDINYLMEVIKDRKDELDELSTQYAEIANKESTTTLLARISTIHDEIIAIDAKITALGDISTLRQNVTTNTNSITSLKDASNFTTTGKAAIASMSMPSSNYTNLTLGASGSQYTAPADGWIYIRKKSGAAYEYLELAGKIDVLRQSTGSDEALTLFIPISKSQTATVWYTASGTTVSFKFIYANGAN